MMTRRLVLLRACERRERRPRVSVLRAARDWRVVTPARARCPITRDDNGRSMDDASFRHKTTTTKERRKDTGRTSVSSWTACPGAYPAYPAMSESPEKVVRTSSRVQTQPSERERPKKRSTTFSSPKAAFLCVVERVVGWWWCLSSFLPFFITTFFKTHEEKQTNKQTNCKRTKKETNTPKF